MPDGKTHQYVLRKYQPLILWSYLGFEIGVSVIAYWMREWMFAVFMTQILAWGVIFYVQISKFIDPDLDQLGVTSADGRQMREFGVFGYFLYAYWTFYASMMALICKVFRIKGSFGTAHRSWLTHKVFPGTIIRVLFFDLPIYIVFVLVRPYIEFTHYFYVFLIAPFLIGQTLGLAQADWIHVFLDENNNEGVIV